MRSSVASAAIAASAALALAGLVGCAPAQIEERPLPRELRAEVMQTRADLGGSTARIRLVNGSEAELVLASASFASPLLSDEAAWTGGPATVRAGGTVDLPVELPPAVCGQAAAETPAPDDEAGRTTLMLLVSGTAGVETEIDTRDPYGRIPALAAEQCFARDVTEVVELSLRVEAPPEPVGTAQLVVTAQPRGVGTARILSARSTPLFSVIDPAGSRALVAAVGGEQGTLVGGSSGTSELRISIEPARCDAHALAEDKVGTLFGLDVVLASGDAAGSSGVVRLRADAPRRDALYGYLRAYCG